MAGDLDRFAVDGGLEQSLEYLTQVLTTAAYGFRHKGRMQKRISNIKEVASKTVLQRQVAGTSAMSIVSNEGDRVYFPRHESSASE